MRTTITLDDDVAARLRELAYTQHTSFKAIVNQVLRRGLADDEMPSRPYVVQPRPLGLRADIDFDKALTLAGQLEDEEILRKLELRK